MKARRAFIHGGKTMKHFLNRLVQRFKVKVSSETEFDAVYQFCPALVAYRESQFSE
jgi:hypothetical protein